MDIYKYFFKTFKYQLTLTENKPTKEVFFMRRIIITIAILALFLISGCLQQTTQTKPTIPIEEPKEPEQICTEMWLCKDENTKAYRKSDCTFEQTTNCPAGCENSACKPEEIIEKPKPKEEPKETKEKCTIGWKCLDANRKGYQSSNCMFTQVEQCKGGCKDGKCLPALAEEKEEETFSLTQGKAIFNKTGWKYTDFSNQKIFLEAVDDYDFKMKLYSSASGYNYYRAESYRSDLWVIKKGIEQATRSDCVEKIAYANAYENLKTAQTLCIQTREKDIALVGGYWEGLPKEDTELTWKYYS